MANQRTSYHLSPQLCAVLSSLTVELDAELNRYRRNRGRDGLADGDLFADLEDPSFDLDPAGAMVASPISAQPVVPAMVPPSLPRNRKLPSESPLRDRAECSSEGFDRSPESPPGPSLDRPKLHEAVALSPVAAAVGVVSRATLSSVAEHPLDKETPDKKISGLAAVPLSSVAIEGRGNELVNGAVVEGSGPEAIAADIAANPDSTIANGYLASSQGLIESLATVPVNAEPMGQAATQRTATQRRSKRQTVSLLTGATLGFLGLLSGLGVSYLMSNPVVAQRLANRLNGGSPADERESGPAFDPPGPDLAAQEFIDLKLDNLSSLRMAPLPLDPQALPPLTTANASPSLDQATETTQAGGGNSPTGEVIASFNPLQPMTQSAATPANVTYYITVPFTTESALMAIRQVVNEAFVRRFADGNRIQIAAFDNPNAAQAFVTELKTKNIDAQIYGPTTE